MSTSEFVPGLDNHSPIALTDDEDDILRECYAKAVIDEAVYKQTNPMPSPSTQLRANISSIQSNGSLNPASISTAQFGSVVGIQGHDFEGVLSKWTNYIHGWQDRFIVLKDGTLSYYKSQNDLAFGCRGSLSIFKATIRPHDLDDCRFDVSVNDCVWYLRAASSEEKMKWVEALEHYKSEAGSSHESFHGLQRYGSAMSISSNTLSGASGSNFPRGHTLKAKLSELETYRDILLQQIDTLQRYFDMCSGKNLNISGDMMDASPIELNGLGGNGNNFDIFHGSRKRKDSLANMSFEPEHSSSANVEGRGDAPTPTSYQTGLSTLDFRGESLTFKATTAGVLTALAHCIEAMAQHEEVWKKRVDEEVEKRKKVEDYFKQKLVEAHNSSKVSTLGPDCEEGPHSSLKEDEFYDAVETALDRMQDEEEFRERLKLLEKGTPSSPQQAKASQHRFWPEIDRITLEQLHYARLGVGEGGWELFAEDGEMKMYKREEEIDGLVVDPLKAQHTVKGFTAHEMCHLFFSPEVRMEWEMTLEQMTILEKVSDDTIVFLQIHKRVWPATQRDALFWSHIRSVPDSSNPNAQDIWIVCNHSTDHERDIDSNGKYIRVFLTVSLVCQTIIDPPKDGGEITRDNLTCRITYCSVVNPGGWAPASVLRAVYKREYPRFLKKFTQYVLDKCKDQPIMY